MSSPKEISTPVASDPGAVFKSPLRAGIIQIQTARRGKRTISIEISASMKSPRNTGAALRALRLHSMR